MRVCVPEGVAGVALGVRTRAEGFAATTLSTKQQSCCLDRKHLVFGRLTGS